MKTCVPVIDPRLEKPGRIVVNVQKIQVLIHFRSFQNEKMQFILRFWVLMFFPW